MGNPQWAIAAADLWGRSPALHSGVRVALPQPAQDLFVLEIPYVLDHGRPKQRERCKQAALGRAVVTAGVHGDVASPWGPLRVRQAVVRARAAVRSVGDVQGRQRGTGRGARHVLAPR